MFKHLEALALVSFSAVLISCGSNQSVYSGNSNGTLNTVAGAAGAISGYSSAIGSANSSGTNTGTSSGTNPGTSAGTNPGSGSGEDDSLLMDFGGMFGDYMDAGVSKTRVNPFTNSSFCPAGYTQTRFTLASTDGEDYVTYYCWRQHVAGRAPDWDFGGAFGYTTGAVPYPNPITNGANCPAGYTMAQAHGSSDWDWPIFYCYRTHQAGQPGAARFGGLVGSGVEPTTGNYVIYNNPLTGAPTCPAAYSASQILGTVNLDHNVYLCSQH